MKKEKTKIVYFKFIEKDENGFVYEIKFNKSLEDTVRMQSMCNGLDRFDRMKPAWKFIHNLIAHPLLITNTSWAQKFHDYTGNRM